MEIVLAPDVYVNASVALGSPPERVVTKLFTAGKGKAKATEWILERIEAMLGAIPSFKHDAIKHQMEVIRSLVEIVDDPVKHGPDAWEAALVAAAKAAKVRRVVTDHPDLDAKEASDGIEFVSTEPWLVEAALPPPPPPPGAKKSSPPSA